MDGLVSKTYVFDIDGTICTFTNGKYDLCEPIIDHIDIVNELHSQGNKIILFTARGMDSCNGNQMLAHKKYFHYTCKQVKSWGLNYDKIYFGKPKADIYVDDLGSDLTFFKKFKKPLK